jgi:hypothetical protein
MTLAEKVKQAAEAGEDEHHAAQLLKESLEGDESNKIWGRHKTWMAKNPLEKGKYEALTKKEKGLSAALWLLQTEGKRFLKVTHEVTALEKATREDKWSSEKQMLEAFGSEDLEKHLMSGRVIWREDPMTWGVYEYKDTQNWSRKISGQRATSYQEGMEVEASEENLEKFQQLYDQESLQLADTGSCQAFLGKGILGKGAGKGLGKNLGGKGSGKSKDSGKSYKGETLGKGNKRKSQAQLALENGPEDDQKDEASLLQEAVKKVRKARDQTTVCLSNLEEALEKATPQLSEAGQAAAQEFKAKLLDLLGSLKVSLKNDKTLEELRELLQNAASLIKGAKDETKELRQLANKTASVCPSNLEK